MTEHRIRRDARTDDLPVDTTDDLRVHGTDDLSVDISGDTPVAFIARARISLLEGQYPMGDT